MKDHLQSTYLQGRSLIYKNNVAKCYAERGKTILVTIGLFYTGLLLAQAPPSSAHYGELWDWSHLQHMGDDLRYFAEGRFGDAHSRFGYYEDRNRQDVVTSRQIQMDFDVDVYLKAGEFIICQSNVQNYVTKVDNFEAVSYTELCQFDYDNMVNRVTCEYEHIDDQTIFLRAKEDSHIDFWAARYIGCRVSDFPDVNPLPTTKEDVPDSLFYDVAMWKIGNIVSYELVPLDSKYSDIIDYIISNKWEEKTNIEIMFCLTNDIECLAIDTYGQEIRFMCPSYCWDIDIDAKSAVFTPYFVPRLYKTQWECGTPLEMTWLNKKSLHLPSFSSGGTVTDIATINANATAQDVWYDMFGRKYITKPTAAGLYIHNGKKEVVK